MDRRSALKALAGLAAAACHKRERKRVSERMPVIFVGHGSPMNAIEQTQWSTGFAKLAAEVPRPKAILAVSAHWYVNGTYLTDNSQPKTIHDFSGFPPRLYEIQYPAPGSPTVASRVRQLLDAELRSDWGLDHGTWSVLRWIYPDADIPVVQLSVDRRLAPKEHLEIARSLAAVRDEGVLVIGSGNITHNLRDAMGRGPGGETPSWAEAFDKKIESALTDRDEKTLVSTWPDDDDARMAHPSPDHWLPLLYAYGASTDDDAVRFPTVGFDMGSLSMRNVVFG